MADLSNWSNEQLAAALQAQMRSMGSSPFPIAANPATDYGGDTLQVGPLNTGIQLGQGTQNFLAGAGKALSDAWTGAEQLVGIGPSKQQVDSRRALDAPLMKTGAGIGGNLAGNIAAYAPLYMIPGANTIPGAAALGGAMGAAAPVGTQDSRLLNAGLGAAAGAAGQGIGRLMGRVVSPVSSRLAPEQQAAANVAQNEGIPLRLSQQVGSKPLGYMESVLGQLPFSSSGQAAEREAQQRAFTQAVLNRAGIQGSSATPEVINQQFGRLGNTFGKIAGQKTLSFNSALPSAEDRLLGALPAGQSLTDRFATIMGNAQTRMPPSDVAKLGSTLDNILSQVGQDGSMSGTNYQGWREPLRILGKGSDLPASYYRSVRKAMDSAFTSQLAGPEAQEWAQTSRQYAALKQIAKAMGGAGVQTKGGLISPAQLEAAVRGTVGREGVGRAISPLNDLVNVGRQFVSENLPDSGTAQRNFYLKALTGSLPGAAIGGGIGYSNTGNMRGAAEGAALGSAGDLALSMVLPKLAQTAITNPVVRSYLTNGLLSDPQRALISNITRPAALGLLGTMRSQAQ